ncbi:MAG TPA: DNA-directed RNA polymerase subunit L [Methanomicrobia archaeon]|nr:DNA-directed RNA polymerase subunit L [Methanomicrobia archaeon]
MAAEEAPEIRKEEEEEEQQKKLTILERTEDAVRMEIAGEDHTLLALLTATLLDDPQVNIATYNIPETLQSNPILYVKMNSGDPLEAVKTALRALAAAFDEFEQKYRAAIV